MTALTAIQTNYAGCRFRSRLEARWAVFFDSLGLEWLYEPQGFTVGPDRMPYLPDFWLPDFELWVEVKGVLEEEDLHTLIWATSAAGLPLSPDGQTPCPRDEVFPYRERLLILGEVPDPRDAWIHTRLDLLAEDLVVAAGAAFFVDDCFGPVAPGPRLATIEPVGRTMRILNQYVAGRETNEGFRRGLNNGLPHFGLLATQGPIANAYRAARSARFEHGESGAPTAA